MCGIAGFASNHCFLDGQRLVLMRDALAHRGPDDSGAILWDEGEAILNGSSQKAAVGLAHRRLSIIDLSSAGRQPMSNEDASVWITCNGEFYNYADHRKCLSRNHRFASDTDTETIIHLFEDNGIESTLACMNGMFAFALWDASANTMYLARDRLGKKPLYYVYTPDGNLVFASEIKALLAGGVVDAGKIDREALAQYWTYGYITGERTIYEQVKRLLPGHYGVWNAGKLSLREYWDCPFGQETFANRSLADMAEELEALLCDAIKLRLVSDVPIGLFLSGGIDSSLVAALTAKIVGSGMRSYTIGFSDQNYDESAHAKAIADHLRIENTVLQAEVGQAAVFSDIARHFDEPFGDPSAVPTYYVAALAKDYVTVALTGDGGDELFAGYELYQTGLSLWGDRDQRKCLGRRGRSLRLKLSDVWFRHRLKHKKLSVLPMLISPRNLRKILAAETFGAMRAGSGFKDREQWYERVRDADLLSQLQYVDVKTYLPDDVLVKVDRMSMAHALECRSPLLDYRVAEFAARLPYRAKISGAGKKKIILRQIVEKYVPATLLDRPKRGFSAPWSSWAERSYGERLEKAWLTQSNGFQAPAGADVLFSESTSMKDRRQWLAFSALVFFEDFE